jgi:hypothetical protein
MKPYDGLTSIGSIIWSFAHTKNQSLQQIYRAYSTTIELRPVRTPRESTNYAVDPRQNAIEDCIEGDSCVINPEDSRDNYPPTPAGASFPTKDSLTSHLEGSPFTCKRISRKTSRSHFEVVVAYLPAGNFRRRVFPGW